MTIFEQIGGAASLQVAVELFYTKVTADPALAGYFEGVDLARLKGHQRAFLAGALGGAEVYGGRDMGAAHAGLDITDSDFDRVVGHLVSTLDALEVPEDTIDRIGTALAPLRADIVSRRPAAISPRRP